MFVELVIFVSKPFYFVPILEREQEEIESLFPLDDLLGWASLITVRPSYSSLITRLDPC